MKNKIKNQIVTFLGPLGATFSHDAYNVLAQMFGAPKVSDDSTTYQMSHSNDETISLIMKNGGYGVVPVETLAEGRVDELIESFIELLTVYKKTEDCPLTIAGGIEMKIGFCLMARKGINKKSIENIVGHAKAIGACKQQIQKLRLKTVEVQSNGEAARLVAEDPQYKNSACLGPKSAAEKYGLQILSSNFEDSEAITTFFLIAPRDRGVVLGKVNRALIVFKLPHTPGSLVRALQCFYKQKLNLVQIHSMYAGNKVYNFAIEIEFTNKQTKDFEKSISDFKKNIKQQLLFGPFEMRKS